MFLPDDETCFHLFEAVSAYAVEQVSRRAELGRARVVPAVEALPGAAPRGNDHSGAPASYVPVATGPRACTGESAGAHEQSGETSPSRPFRLRYPSACSACISLCTCVVPS